MSAISEKNIKLFIAFRVLFNARFYYPIFTILFLDFGLTLEQFAILNSIWAASIVLFEVPTGALADSLGRRAMIRISAVLMTIEFLILILLPVGDNNLVFWGFLFNRILSGIAEAFYSGADEALAYDHLKSRGLEAQWPLVLRRLMKVQSVCFVLALLVGSTVYDPDLMNKFASFSGLNLVITQQDSLKFPLYLMLLSCAAALFCAFKLEEINKPGQKQKHSETIRSSIVNIKDSAIWIWNTKLALIIISAGMLFDCVIRLFLTLNSEYYRQIAFPTWSFGFLGATLSCLGFLVPGLSVYLTQHKSKAFNYLFSFCLCLTALFFISKCIPYFGFLPVALLYICMYNLNFLLSHYLNQIAKSEIRATILSFKSLAFNLSYGLIGLFYAYLTSLIKEDSNQDLVFVQSIVYLPWIFLFLSAVFLLLFRSSLFKLLRD